MTAAKQPPAGDENTYTTRKRLFIGLILGASLLVCVILVLLWVIPYIGLRTIHPWAPAVLGVVFAALLLVVLWAGLGLVLNILLGRPVLFSKRLRGLTIKLFLPLMTLLGRLLGIDKTSVRNSFIKVNNELVRSEARRYKPEEVLLLMPHCLQSSSCEMRLTYDINNCKRCGKCPIKGLLELSDRYGVHLAIATGGTIARRIVVQNRPKMILAVACERDLSSGIQDTYPLPVFGVLNERPHGPCLDTLVSLERLEKALLLFLDPESLPRTAGEKKKDSARLHSMASVNAPRTGTTAGGDGSGPRSPETPGQGAEQPVSASSSLS
jgi:uncharacterized protein